MSLTTAQRALYGRIGAAVARSRHSPSELTAAGRAAFLGRFVEQARDLHPDANDAEIVRVADELKRAHFLRLAAASSRARATKKAASSTKADGLEDRDATSTPHRPAA